MSQPENPDNFHLSYSAPASEPLLPVAARFVSYLAFEGHGTRIGLEFSLCVFLYFLFRTAFVGIAGTPDAAEVFAWFVACGIVAVIDQLVLCRPVHTYRMACQLDMKGKYQEAIEALSSIAVASGRFVHCPPALYHFRHSRILTNARQFEKAAAELERARTSGLKNEVYYIARSEIAGATGDFESARKELEQAEGLSAQPSIKFQHALLLLRENKNYQAAKALLEEVAAMENSLHPSGESTQVLALAFREVTRLWTGYAEEAIDGLSDSISTLRTSAIWHVGVRPLLALLYLERAYYYATHKEPNKALIDLAVGRQICSYPMLLTRIGEIEAELAWRHNM